MKNWKIKISILFLCLLGGGTVLAQFIPIGFWNRTILPYVYTETWTWMHGENFWGPYTPKYGTWGAAAYANTPGVRSQGASWTDSSGNLWQFGGEGHGEYWGFGQMSDLWKFNPTGCLGRGCWTWMHGNNVEDIATVPGTKGTAATTNKPGGRHSMAYAYDGTNLWMFGGYGIDSAGNTGWLNDLWKYNPSGCSGAGCWTWVSGNSTRLGNATHGTINVGATTNIPGARSGTAAWFDGTNLWFYGGEGRDSATNNGILGDLWRYEISTNKWMWVNGPTTRNNTGTYGTKGTPAVGNVPGNRRDMAEWVDASGNLWLYGGIGYPASGSAGYLADLWKYDRGTGFWTWMSGSDLRDQTGVYGTKGTAASGNLPGSIEDPAQWIDSSGNLWMQGGNGYDSAGTQELRSSMWKYDVATGWWTWVNGPTIATQKGVYGTKGVAASTNTPPGRYRYGGMWTTGGGTKFWSFGGTGYDRDSTAGWEFYSDMWSFSPATGNWTWERGSALGPGGWGGIPGTQGVAAAANVPMQRDTPFGWYDKTGRNYYMYGGVNSNLWFRRSLEIQCRHQSVDLVERRSGRK